MTKHLIVASCLSIIIVGCKTFLPEGSGSTIANTAGSASTQTRSQTTNTGMLRIDQLIQTMIKVQNHQGHLNAALNELVSQTQPQATSKIQNPALVVTMGGFLSCGIDNIKTRSPSPLITYMSGTPLVETANRLVTVFKEITQRTPVQILSCYGMDASVIYYASSVDSWSQIRVSSIEDFFAYIGQVAREVSASEAFIVGHSYGGWTAMALSTYWASNNAAPVPLSAIVTNDPISKKLCLPEVFINTMGQEGSPCLTSPKDTAVDVPRIVRLTKGQWQNYYQTDATKLHSSEIQEDSKQIQNIRLDYPHHDPEIGGHVFIAFDKSRFIDRAADFLACSSKVGKIAPSQAGRCAKALAKNPQP